MPTAMTQCPKPQYNSRPPAESEPQMDISEYRSQLDECVANAERTDNAQHKNTWLRLAECYRVLIERPSGEGFFVGTITTPGTKKHQGTRCVEVVSGEMIKLASLYAIQLGSTAEEISAFARDLLQ
jgi:hypothetical protein